MPIYDYDCAACGGFTELKPIAECAQPQPCPGCGAPAPRTIGVVHFSGLGSDSNRAHAINERAAHEPKVSLGHRHGPGCGCGSSKVASTTPAASKTFPQKRPWMISH